MICSSWQTIANCYRKLNKLNGEVQTAGMISFPKTEVLAISNGQTNVKLGDKALKTDEHLKYLGSMISTDSDPSKAISANCVKAKIALCKLRPALTSDVLKMTTKVLSRSVHQTCASLRLKDFQSSKK